MHSSLIADRYRLLHPLGEGGMGRVWRARDEVLRRDVAIKELVAPRGLTDAERRELQARSMREARAVARLNHPNVVRIFDVVEVGEGDPWIVMEYLPGQSLHAVMDRGVLPVRQVALIGLQILQALRAAHDVGVVHRDVKPGNILLAHDGRAVLTDFGIAAMPGDPFVTQTGLLLGSPAYLAPERARDSSTSPTADLWSLGATLYAATEGRPPFARATTMETITALVSEPVPPPQRSGPLTPVLIGLLEKDPAHRMDPATAQLLLREALVTPDSVAAPRRGHRRLWLAAGLVAVTVAALALINRSGPGQPQTSPPSPSAAPATTMSQPTATAAPTPTPTPTPIPTPTPSPPASVGFQLPAGWQMRDDGTGFRVPVPNGWQSGHDDDGRPLWQDPGTKRLLLIDQTREPKPDPVQDWRNNEAARRDGYRDYQRVRLERVSYWDSAADWEFTYTLDGTPVHVLNRGFITAPDQAYSIYWRTPASAWEANLDDLQVVLDGFVPARS